MIDRIKTRHIGQQGLGCTDIACGLVASNMLLSGLKRHTVGGLTVGIYRHANDSSGHRSHKISTHRQKGRMWTAKPHGHPKALGTA